MKRKYKINVPWMLMLLPLLALGLYLPFVLFGDWLSRVCAIAVILWLAQSMVWPFVFVQSKADNKFKDE